MTRLLFIFFLLFAACYVGLQLNQDQGYILIVINHWTIETTLLVALIALLLLFIILHGLLLLMRSFIRIPNAYHHWQTKRRSQKAQLTTRKGLIEFSEGYWSSAKNHLIQAIPNTDTPLLNYLTAARAAQEMGEDKLRDDYLRNARQLMPDATIAVELTKAQLQLANQQWEQASITLKHLHNLVPHHPYVLTLLMRLYQEVRDWPQLIALLPKLKANKVVSNPVFETLRRNAFLQAMSDLTNYDSVNLASETTVTDMIKQLPKSLKFDPDLMAYYCSFLIKKNQYALSELILRRCLNKCYNDKLITLYAQFYINDKQLVFAESLLKKHSDSVPLYLCLGHLCLKSNLWGKAKSYFEQSITLKANPEAYAEIGKLFERFGEQDKAYQAYRQGLSLITHTIM